MNEDMNHPITLEIAPPDALMQQGRMDLLEYVHRFEAGASAVYFVDEQDRYTGVMIPRKDLRIEMDADRHVAMPIWQVKPVQFDQPIDNQHIQQLMQLAREGFQDNLVGEVPVVRSDGKIAAVMRVQRDDAESKKILRDIQTVPLDALHIPVGTLYLSSTQSPLLAAFLRRFMRKLPIKLLSAGNMAKVLSGQAEGNLVYDQDIFPDIPKISIRELYRRLLRYAENRQAFLGVKEFSCDLPKQIPDTVGDEPRKESRVKEFLEQAESPNPILLHDAYDVDELMWMCDRLRTSDRFGSDNRLYLRYTSETVFRHSLFFFFLQPIIASGKALFLFNDAEEEQLYHSGSRYHVPEKLHVEEIVELINSIPRGFSGTDFFNMILDSHPCLLTIGWHGLATFTSLYEVFLKNRPAKIAINHLKNPHNDDELYLRDFNFEYMLNYKAEERKPIFLQKLSTYLEPDRLYDMADWLKAFYLAANEAVGRKFHQRISPAIFYDEHAGGQYRVTIEKFGFSQQLFNQWRKELIDGFKYQRYIGVVRAPLSKFGSFHERSLDMGKDGRWIKYPLECLRNFADKNRYGYYLDENNPKLQISRLIRFEDLKLYPKETTKKVCEFLRIPWSPTCLNLTTNGDDGGVVDGTAGFDLRPVYNPHDAHMSALDYYRLELLNDKNFSVWGYKHKYYDGQKFSREELRRLFEIPFKIEKQKLPGWPDWPDAKMIQDFHELVYQRAVEVMEQGETFPPRGRCGKPMKLVPVLYPDVASGQKLYE